MTRWFGLDLRSLAFFRIALALVMLADLYFRAHDLEAFYSDFGVLPRDEYLDGFMNRWILSFHLMTGQVEYVAILMAVQAFFAFWLLFGYRTRLATVICWLFTISLQSRQPMILQAGDVLYRMLLFWAMFLPIGARWSVDAAVGKAVEAVPKRVFTWATVAVVFQCFLPYWFVVLHRQGAAEWHLVDSALSGSAVYFAASIDHFATPFAQALLEYPALMKFLTIFTMQLEIWVPLLALIPWWPTRMLSVVMMWIMHQIFGLTLEVGMFVWISCTSWIPLIPSGFWDFVARFLDRERWNERTARLVAWLQSRFASRSLRWRLGRIGQVVAAITFAYVVIWNIDTLAGKKAPAEKRIMAQICHTAADLYSRGVHGEETDLTMSQAWSRCKRVAWLPRIDQRWNMFSPYPMKGDGWFVIAGTRKNGREVDVWRTIHPDVPKETDGVTFEKPTLASTFYPGQRWRKYLMNLWQKKNKKHRLHFGRWVCRSFNRDLAADDKLETFHMFYMKEKTTLEGHDPVKCVTLWRHYCTTRAKTANYQPTYVEECGEWKGAQIATK